MADTVLEFRNVNTHYGPVHVLKDVSIEIRDGEMVCLLGGNASGKTTTLKTILGMVKPTSGDVVLDGEVISGLPTAEIVAKGVSMVPENRRLFKRMTVRENLEIGAYLRPGDDLTEDLERIFTLFPRVKERLNQKAGTLSGGEQQMVAVGRALMAKPKVLLMDNPADQRRRHDRLHGRAERQYGPVDLRPRLCAADRPDRSRRYGEGAAGQSPDAQSVSGRGGLARGQVRWFGPTAPRGRALVPAQGAGGGIRTLDLPLTRRLL